MKKINLKKLKKNIFYKIISLLLIISSVIFLGLLFYMNLLPTKYCVILSIIVLIFDIFNIILVNLKKLKQKIKKILSAFMILAILIITVANFYIGKTLGVLINNGDSKYKLEHYSVIVLKGSSYKKLNDIKGKKVGFYENSTGAQEANEKLKEKVGISFKPYKTSDTLLNDLLKSEIEVIVVEDSIKSIMEEEIEDFNSLTRVIYNFTIKVKTESTLKEVNVTKESFAIYISGIDTYGEISSVSRSDVNMVMIVNPNIHQILLISIPRDYYVQLHGTEGAKDKLTHAGIYGVDMSIQTIEDLLELDINYYIKVNFTSVIDIVDALGGADVYSEYTFVSYSGYNFKKGLNSVNGEQALDFVRTRKAFSDGDRQRGKNQQALIEALVRKATDKSIITKYNSLLNAINGKYQTNMSMKKITSLIKMQLNDMPSWNITSYSLTGLDSRNYTYTYNQLLYVMEPEEESVKEAIELIDKVINGDQLENSYSDLGSSSNKVTKSYKNNSINTNKVNTQTNTSSKAEEKQEPIIKEDIPEIPKDLDTEDSENSEIPSENPDNELTEPGIEDNDSEIENPIESILPTPEN